MLSWNTNDLRLSRVELVTRALVSVVLIAELIRDISERVISCRPLSDEREKREPMSEIVVAPSGMKLTVRGPKIAQLNILADRKRAVQFSTFDDLIKACTLSIEDPGPLEELYFTGSGDPSAKTIDWSKVTIGDRFTTLVHIRIASTRLGDEYSFRHKCEACEDYTFAVTLKLPDDLTFQPYSDADIAIIRDGGVFSGEVDGHQLTWKVMNGTDEKKAAKRARQAQKSGDMNKDGSKGLITVGVSQRLVSFDGKTNKREIMAAIDDLDDGVFDGIVELLDEHDGGFDNMVEVVCDECGEEQDHRIPFAGDFWRSQRKRKKKAAAAE